MTHSGQDARFRQVSDVQARYTEVLLQKANVIGVAVGMRKRGDQVTDDLVLVVMVSKKVPRETLAPEDYIPAEIEGVPTDVQEFGTFTAF